jgi:hypothetical protein
MFKLFISSLTLSPLLVAFISEVSLASTLVEEPGIDEEMLKEKKKSVSNTSEDENAEGASVKDDIETEETRSQKMQKEAAVADFEKEEEELKKESEEGTNIEQVPDERTAEDSIIISPEKSQQLIDTVVEHSVEDGLGVAVVDYSALLDSRVPGNSERIFSCFNSKSISGRLSPGNDGQWAVQIILSNETVGALLDKDGEALTKIVLINSDSPTSETLRQLTRLVQMDEPALQTLRLLESVICSSFEDWVEKCKIDRRFVDKDDDSKTDIAKREIPTVSLIFPGKNDVNAKQGIMCDFSVETQDARAYFVQTAQNLKKIQEAIEKLQKKRNGKINPEQQSLLDELHALELDNKEKSEQLEAEKVKISDEVLSLENEKAELDKLKITAEQEKKEAEANLAIANGELSNVRNVRDAAQGVLNELNAGGGTSNNRLNAMRGETGNRRLNVNSARDIAQGRINDANGKVAGAETRVNQINEVVTSTEQRIAQAKSDLESIAAKLAGLQARPNELQETINTNNRRIEELKNKPEVIRARVYADDFDDQIKVKVSEARRLFADAGIG